MRIKRFLEFVLEDFADDYPKKEWSDINDTRDRYDELVQLINNAYKNVPGGNLENPEEIRKDPRVNYWMAIDNDEDPECDAVIFGKSTDYGIKLTGMGQDGSLLAKHDVIKMLLHDLKNNGYYSEISDNIISLLKDVPYVDNKKDVEKILGKEVRWIGHIGGMKYDGWYERDIHGHKKIKLLVGSPSI